MGYSTPRTWAAGERPTAAQFNQDVRDNVAFLANPPACKVNRSSAQSIANASLTAVSWNAEVYDTAALHDTVTTPTRLIAPVAGIYVLKASILYGAHDTGYREAVFRVSGSVYVAGATVDADTGTVTKLSISDDVKLTAGAYVELMTSHNAGVALNVDPPSFMSMRWVALG